MANQFQIIGMVTQKALARFINTLGFALQVKNPYQKEFGRPGAKIGDSLNVRLPVNFVGANGPTISPEDIVEQVTPLTINAQLTVAFTAYTSEELLYMDDHLERYVYPAVETLADKFDRLGLSLFNQAYNVVGVPGVSVQQVYSNAGGGAAGQYAVQNLALNAGALLSAYAAPKGDRTLIVNEFQEAGFVGSLTNVFNPADRIGMQYKSAEMKQALGWDWGMDQNMPIFTTGGSSTSVTVNGAGQSGNSLAVTGLTGTVNAGDYFTIPGVYGVNPKNYQSTGLLQQFDVLSTVTGAGGNNTLTITPAINPNVGVAQTVTASPANGATLTFNGGAASGVASTTGLAFHPSAFTWACPELPIFEKGVVDCYRATDKQTGLSIRAITQYDSIHDQLVTRFDLLVAWALIRPQWVVRMQN